MSPVWSTQNSESLLLCFLSAVIKFPSKASGVSSLSHKRLG